PVTGLVQRSRHIGFGLNTYGAACVIKCRLIHGILPFLGLCSHRPRTASDSERVCAYLHPQKRALFGGVGTKRCKMRKNQMKKNLPEIARIARNRGAYERLEQ